MFVFCSCWRIKEEERERWGELWNEGERETERRERGTGWGLGWGLGGGVRQRRDEDTWSQFSSDSIYTQAVCVRDESEFSET